MACILALLLAASGADGRSVSFMVDLREQLDFSRLELPRSRQSRREYVARALKEIADRSQRRLQPVLATLKEKREVESWLGVSIVNRVLVRGRRAAIEVLSANPEVAAIHEEIESAGAPQDSPRPSSGAASWPLDAMGVLPLRRAGIDGTGVTVGLIDSGASAAHEELHDNFRGGPGSWFDPLHAGAVPSDVQLGHGTAVLGCAVGRVHGAAPRAKWIAAAGLDEGRYNNLVITRAADWMLQTGRPDVLIVPWRVPGVRCDRSLEPIVRAWTAAGIIVVFAAGNGGPAPSTDVPPANGEGRLSIGAVDSTLAIDPASSRGPNSCGLGVFPDLVAPGAGLLVALPAGNSLYREASGTSFAAGHAAGVVALLLQACPRAPPERIVEALRDTAVDLGPNGPDNTYGHGLIHAGRALDALRKRRECR